MADPPDPKGDALPPDKPPMDASKNPMEHATGAPSPVVASDTTHDTTHSLNDPSFLSPAAKHQWMMNQPQMNKLDTLTAPSIQQSQQGRQRNSSSAPADAGAKVVLSDVQDDEMVPPQAPKARLTPQTQQMSNLDTSTASSTHQRQQGGQSNRSGAPDAAGAKTANSEVHDDESAPSAPKARLPSQPQQMHTLDTSIASGTRQRQQGSQSNSSGAPDCVGAKVVPSDVQADDEKAPPQEPKAQL